MCQHDVKVSPLQCFEKDGRINIPYGIHFSVRFLQHLYNTERTQSKFFSQDREESGEEFCRPTELREKENSHLAKNQQSVEYCPKSTSRLIRDSAPTALMRSGIKFSRKKGKSRTGYNSCSLQSSYHCLYTLSSCCCLQWPQICLLL